MSLEKRAKTIANISSKNFMAFSALLLSCMVDIQNNCCMFHAISTGLPFSSFNPSVTSHYPFDQYQYFLVTINLAQCLFAPIPCPTPDKLLISRISQRYDTRNCTHFYELISNNFTENFFSSNSCKRSTTIIIAMWSTRILRYRAREFTVGTRHSSKSASSNK